MGSEVQAKLGDQIPLMRNRFDMLRQWSVRRKIADEWGWNKETEKLDSTSPAPSESVTRDPAFAVHCNGERGLVEMVRGLIDDREGDEDVKEEESRDVDTFDMMWRFMGSMWDIDNDYNHSL
jgi:hypothetical protein